MQYDLDQSTHQVVVVGAGPAGLVAAIALAKQGVECLVVERRAGPPARPRATVVSLRNMELLRSWGLDEAAKAGGNDVDWLLLECETLAQAPAGVTRAVGYPTREQSALLSPTAPGCIPQDHLESVLRDHLRSLPGAQLRLGVELVEIDPTSEHRVRLTLRDVTTDSRLNIDARYVIGADGGRSSVRDALPINIVGHDAEHHGVHVEFRAPLWSLVGPKRYGIYAVMNPESSGILLPAGRHDRWIYGFEWDPNTDQSKLEADRLTRRVLHAIGAPDVAVTIDEVTAFTVAAQLADRFKHGDVFLVGDAAHRITPRGGTGMNTAIADGFDLGWKLAWVLQGWASPALLDTYELERRPLVEHNFVRSVDEMGSRRPAVGELPVDLAGRIPHLLISGPSGPASTLDLVGDGLTLLTTRGRGAWARAAASTEHRVPIAVHSLDEVTARAIGIARDGAVLVRPDGLPVAAWFSADHAQRNLQEAVVTVTGDTHSDGVTRAA